MQNCSAVYSIVADLKAFNILIFNPVISFRDNSQNQSELGNVSTYISLVYHIDEILFWKKV